LLALGNLLAIFVGLKRKEKEVIYCLPFAGIYLAQISNQQRFWIRGQCDGGWECITM